MSCAENSGKEIGVSSKKLQEGQAVEVELGLKLQNQDRPFMCNETRVAGDDDDDEDSYYPPANSLSKPSGGMATAAMGFPFTASQWKELERQAMIYKYMMASLPVPPHLLCSSFLTNLSPNSTFAPTSYLMGKCGSGFSMKWSGNSNSKDAEPGRCRRTDGKKWRCSRDVVPNQKYCERHVHKGRPRSRKHVELHDHSLSNLPINNHHNSAKDDYNNPTKKTRFNGSSNPQSVGFRTVLPSKDPIFGDPVVPGANPFQDSRSLTWTDEQQWNQLVNTNMNSSVFQHQFEGGPLNLNSHAGFNSKSNDMGLLDNNRPLIDAWSMGLTVSKDDSGNNNTSSDISFSKSHGKTADEEMCQIHMGLGLIDSWVTSTTTPGGPLAEVLRPGNPAMTSAGNGDLVTPTATAVSSQSGVLQKTLASFSDGSGGNSPTCNSSKANSDVPFHWLN